MLPPSRWIAVALALAVIDTAHGGIRPGSELALQSADFASLDGWSQSASDGGAHFATSTLPGWTTVQADVPPGASATLAQSLGVDPFGPIEATSPMELGPRLEFGVFAWFPQSATYPPGGTLRVEIATDGPGTNPLARSPVIAPATLPRDRWIWIATEPFGGDGRLDSAATQATVRIIVSTSGAIHFDRARCGHHEATRFPLVDGGFEGPLAPSWEPLVGSASLSDPISQPDAYFGDHYLELGGAGRALVLQRLPLGVTSDGPRPFQPVEAGAWVHVESAGAPNGNAFQLSVRSWIQGTSLASSKPLATRRWAPTAGEHDRWIWLETNVVANATVPPDATHLLVVLQKPFAGNVRVDGVEVGEPNSVRGHPARLALANYVGRYRSPLWPLAPTNPTSAQGRWRGWLWVGPPACSATTQWAHDPDCTSNPDSCYRANGRRDTAVTIEGSLDRLPLAGSYDSRDRDLVRYHVEVARATGLDALVFDWLGAELALQQQAFGTEALNDAALDALFDVAEEPGSDLKLAVMYEPKVWFLNWVGGAPTFADKVAGITSDLVQLVARYGQRKAALRSSGRLVVFVFRHRQCLPAGPCLEDADWADIAAAVEATTGERLALIGDTVPPGIDFQAGPSWYPSFAGMLHWQLLDLPFLRYRTFAAAASGQPSLPLPTLADVDQHARALNRRADQWKRQDDAQRVSVGTTWPGFDDTGVAGWSQPNFPGSDGQPLCVRVADPISGAFFAAAGQTALDARPDWLQVLTWNDWNEDTAIEPAWNATWQAAVLAGQAPDPIAVDAVFRRTLEAQAQVTAFKQLAPGALSSSAVTDAATRYVQAARYVPAVVEYD